jgi:hypothetical protein
MLKFLTPILVVLSIGILLFAIALLGSYNKPLKQTFCISTCGDNVCQLFVCAAVGCPCVENIATCPQDCSPNYEKF